jgi:heme/copper-type cytochrome/quinol oxidase subunit 2
MSIAIGAYLILGIAVATLAGLSLLSLAEDEGARLKTGPFVLQLIITALLWPVTVFHIIGHAVKFIRDNREEM